MQKRSSRAPSISRPPKSRARSTANVPRLAMSRTYLSQLVHVTNLISFSSGLLNSGFKVSRSHACPGSLKTTATKKDVHDLFRNWIKTHPVKMDNLSQGSPALVLLSKEAGTETDFTRHPDSVTASSKVKLVRYQQNPAPFWGPGTKAVPGKRKRATEDVGESS